MICRLLCFATALLASSTCSAPKIARAHGIAPVPSTHKLTATSPGNLRAFPVRPVQLRAARGEWECFQIVVRADARGIKNLKLRPTILATNLGRFIGRDNVQVFRENFVYVAKPSGNAELKPLWWSDALIPLDDASASTCEAGKAIAFWVAVRTPKNAEPGQYYGAIDFDIDGEPRTLAVTLDAEKIAMPAPTMRGTVAVYYDILRDWYKKSGREFSDADWEIQKRTYYDFLLDYRINAYDLPVAWDDARAAKYLQDARVTSVRLPPLDSPEMPLALKTLRGAGAMQKAFYYRIDEPTPEAYPQVLEASKKLRALDPKLKQLVTIHPNEALQDAVDIWCPNIGDAMGVGWLDFKRLESERKKGRETWWYTMVEPKFPYPTWLVDDDALAIRSYGWMMARWEISGFVYSMAHGWGPNPLENLQSFADTNGDGTLLYPGELVGVKGPIPSIRLMLLRDAIEDYELFKSLPEIPRKILSGAPLSAKDQRLSAKDQRPRRSDDIKWRSSEWQPANGQERALIFEAFKNRFPTPNAITVRTNPFLPLGLEQVRAIPVMPAPHIDGNIKDAAWNAGTRVEPLPFLKSDGFFNRSRNDPITWPQTSLYLARDSKYLYVAMRAREGAPIQSDLGFTLEIAPRDGHEKWRFLVPAGASLLAPIQRYTREGRFLLVGDENSGFQSSRSSSTGYTDVEMAVPLALLPGQDCRLNVLRVVRHSSGARVTLRAFDDAGDARVMPLFRVQ